jgi:hypothetical protein
MRPRPLGDPRRVFDDPAERGYEPRAIQPIQFIERHVAIQRKDPGIIVTASAARKNTVKRVGATLGEWSILEKPNKPHRPPEARWVTAAPGGPVKVGHR